MGGGGVHSRSSGLPDYFAYVPVFNPAIEVVTFCLREWCMLGVFFVAGIQPSRTRMSGSFQSVRGNTCAHRLDLGLYSHPKEFWGMEPEPMLTTREKSRSVLLTKCAVIIMQAILFYELLKYS